MILEIDFEELENELTVGFKEIEQAINVGFEELHTVSEAVIPSDYGKITYNQDKTLIVS